jgi:hypothetical protein
MPDGETMRALFSGLVAGAIVAFATTTIALIAIARDPRWVLMASTVRVPLPLAGVVVVNGMMLGWTMVGLVLGAFYLAAEGSISAGGLGTTNLLFSSLVTGAVVLVLAAGAYIRGRLTWPMWSTAFVAALSLGWLLPNLAR